MIAMVSSGFKVPPHKVREWKNSDVIDAIRVLLWEGECNRLQMKKVKRKR